MADLVLREGILSKAGAQVFRGLEFAHCWKGVGSDALCYGSCGFVAVGTAQESGQCSFSGLASGRARGQPHPVGEVVLSALTLSVCLWAAGAHWGLSVF